MKDTTEYFKPSELQYSYSEFKKIAIKKKSNLSKDELEWLYAWEFYDLAVSPMADEERRLIRYGHYKGWFDRKHTEQHLVR